MKVIVNNDTIKVTCSGCHSVLGVEASDIHVNDVGHGLPPQWVTCPLCNKVVSVPLEKIPIRWRSQIFDD